jgi:hypothetical protein
MYRSYIAMGLMALGVFTYAQYSGLSVFATEESKPVPGQRSAVHK